LTFILWFQLFVEIPDFAEMSGLKALSTPR
jgi:hypothetical protein